MNDTLATQAQLCTLGMHPTRFFFAPFDNSLLHQATGKYQIPDTWLDNYHSDAGPRPDNG